MGRNEDVAKKKISKSAAVRLYMDANPDKSVAEIAKAVKVSTAIVYNVRSSLKKKSEAKAGNGAVAKGRKTRLKRVATANGSSSDEFSNVLEAARLIQNCGGVERARSAIKAAEQIASTMR